MRTHPRIARLLAKNLPEDYRRSLRRADCADKRARSYRPEGITPAEVEDGAHADLVKHGIEFINGMRPDTWLCRLQRDIEFAHR